MDSGADSMVSGGDSALICNSLNWLCQNEENILVQAKQLESQTLTMTSSQSNAWSMILTIILPAVILLAGVIVWSGRRKR